MGTRKFIAVLLFSGSAIALRGGQVLTLQSAIDQKLVQVSIRGLGGHQGLCISMSLKNLAAKPLDIRIEAGRRLNSEDDAQQDLLITGEQIIALREHEYRSFKIKGYCCQLSRRSPAAGSFYGANKLADSALVKLARYLSSRELDPEAEQAAVWAISDGMPSASISGADSLLLPLRRLVCALKGETEPWYTIFSKTVVFGSGALEVYPLWLCGELEFSSDAYSYTTLHVLNEAGMEVGLIVEQWTPAGLQRYPLNLPLKGLARGKYLVELKNSRRRLAAREFEI